MAATEMETRLSDLEQALSTRIARLEEQVAQLAQQERASQPRKETAWWKGIVGVFQDDPEFEAAMQLGLEDRSSS